MFKTDLPITSSKEEKKYGLKRCNFAQSLGEAIISYKEKESIVIGLSGEWGSGKTSLVNMALEHVESVSSNLNDDEKPIIIKFNPWNFSDQNKLFFEFFNELSTAMEKYKSTKESVQKLKSYAIKLAIIGGTIANPQAMKGLMDYIKLENLDNRDLEHIRENIDKSLKEQKHKIIINMEDIDRLNSLEIRQIFQLVKLLANFPNTIYLLEFDKNIVIKSLEEDIHKDYSSQYLEKIVQVIFEVPKISEKELKNIFYFEIDEILKSLSPYKLQELDYVYEDFLRYYFKNIRDINRYINTLKFIFNIVKNDVDIADFFAITAIHVFMPEIYYEIANNKELFAYSSGLYPQILDKKNQGKFKEDFEKIIELNKLERVPNYILHSFMMKLFPKLYFIYGNYNYDFAPLEGLILNKKISVEENFDTYFKFSVSKSELLNEEFELMLSFSDPIEFTETLLNLDDSKKIKFLEEFDVYISRNYHDRIIPEENIEKIFEILIDIGDLLPENFFSMSSLQLIYSIFVNLDIELEEQEKTFDILKNAIYNAERSLYTPCHLVNHEYESEMLKKPHIRSSVLNGTQLHELKGICCEKIENWINEKGFKNLRRPLFILSCLKEWKGEADVKSLMNNLDPENTKDLILNILTNPNNHPIEKYTSNVEEFIDTPYLKSKLLHILNPNNFKLNKNDKTALKNFVNAIN